MSDLVIKFFPNQDYVVNFFENYEVAFSAPFVFNDCFESYILPSKENRIISSDLQILAQSKESALCFCCSRLNDINELVGDHFELMWAHYASSHCGIGVIFKGESAFSYLEKDAVNASETTNNPMRYAAAKYSYCYSGIEIQYVNSDQIDHNPSDNFKESSRFTNNGRFGELVANPVEFSINAENTINKRQPVNWSAIFAKNSIWSYEQETRFIIQRNPNFKPVSNTQKFLVKLNKDSINGIVFANRFYNDEDLCFACQIIKAILKNPDTINWGFYHLRKSIKYKKLEQIDISDLIHKIVQYYHANTKELEEITQDLMAFFKEQNESYFESTSDPQHAFKQAKRELGADAVLNISNARQNIGCSLNIDSSFNPIPDSLPESTISKIISDPIIDKYPLAFFRILKEIDPTNKLTYETRSKNKLELKNFGIELRYAKEDAKWNTVFTKVPTFQN